MGSKIAISLSIIYFLELHSKTSINHKFKICPGIWLKCSSNLFFRYPQSHEVDNWDGNHIWCSTELCSSSSGHCLRICASRWRRTPPSSSDGLARPSSVFRTRIRNEEILFPTWSATATETLYLIYQNLTGEIWCSAIA